MHTKLLSIVIAAAALGPAVRADFITGQVVDSNGIGVPGVDIDAKSLSGGGNVTLFNDGTDINGFFNTTIPAGIYRITFNPPPPPVTTHLVLEICDVIVVGTKNMGVVTLPPGVSVAGTLQNQAGLPVAGVNLDVIDQTTGNNLTLFGPGQVSDAFGNFIVSAPAGPIELRFDTTPVFGPLLAPQSMQLSPTANTNIGIVTLPPGFLVTATVLAPGGVPVANADLDAKDDVTNALQYTPGDNSDSTGFLDVVLAAGTYDILFCPPNGSALAGAKLNNVVIAGTTNLGTVSLAQGFTLSGVVTAFDGQTHAGVDVNAFDLATGISVNLCGNDNTKADGSYSVRLPVGTYSVHFTPPLSLGLSPDIHPNVTVAGDTVLNGTMASGQVLAYCNPKASSSGCLATMTANQLIGPTSGANDFSVTVSGAQAFRPGIFFGSTSAQAMISFQGGTLCVQPPLKRSTIFFTGGTNGQCDGTFSLLVNDGVGFPFGMDAGPGGTSYMQAWYRDNFLMDGFNTALSNGLQLTWQ